MPVTDLKGVGPNIANRLQRLGIRTVADLLFHLPLRYQDRTRVVALSDLRPGDEIVVEGEVLSADVIYARRRSLLVEINDGSASLILRFFHFGASQQRALAPGVRLRCFGEVRRGPRGLEMIHPEYRSFGEERSEPVEDHLTPIYPTTEGLHQLSLRKWMTEALDWLERREGALDELVPRECLPKGVRWGLREAVRLAHRPPSEAFRNQMSLREHPARLRLAFEELLAHQLSFAKVRVRMRRRVAPAIRTPGTLWKRFAAALPFKLTSAQVRVIREIKADLAQGHPMLRLLQGDVGSGKTVVALAACLELVESGCQAAVMAPTELLAEQHLRNFSDWLMPFGVQVAWLAGKQRPSDRKEMLARVVTGEAPIVVGTHALFQEGVEFKRLGMVIVDEQHRFGVHQRLALGDKGKAGAYYPHQLIMTATPIPRTLAMTAYADLDYSVIDEMPAGRTPVNTVAVPNSRRQEVVERVARACANGSQAYWVCTLVEESEALQCQAAEATADRLADVLSHLKVGLVHGRLSAADKGKAMQDFKNRKIDLLVATTVIEVGVDVPNASLMVIENPERLGLAQLHQLRGRVGRGQVQSNCVLMYHPPLSETARQRLRALRNTTDGFEIAQVDLELRGPGEVLGTRQAGMLQFKIADLIRDQALLPAVRRAATELLNRHPENVTPLIRRWVGDAIQFGHA